MINTHYLADKIPAALKNYAGLNIEYSYEPEILDTGGGLKKALPFFKNEPFFVLSGDGLWDDGPDETTLKQMSAHWNPETMDILIALQPTHTMHLTQGVGDYDIDSEGRALRAHDRNGAHMFTSMRIHHPRIFDNAPNEPFSYLKLLDEAQNNKRLYGIIHDGAWHHISTPDDLTSVNAHYSDKESQ